MRTLQYFDGTRMRNLQVQGIYDGRQRAPRSLATAGPTQLTAMRAEQAGDSIASSISAQHGRLARRFNTLNESNTEVAIAEPGATTVIPTNTVAVDNPSKDDLRFLRSKHGLEVAEEGRHSKVLLLAPGDQLDGVVNAFDAAEALHNRSSARGVPSPNFVRLVQRTRPSAAVAPPWALSNSGVVGRTGSDVHANAAWTVTEGGPEVRVAILDEGVDSTHPRLATIVAELDVVDNNPHARPSGDDAHGTACAGIVSCTDADSALAPNVSIVAARIAKSDAAGFWIFDDFDTADAVDWCWDDARADVLSNSWGGGPPVAVITNAFNRAMSLGRGGKGAVVVAAAGNDANPSVSYPSNLPRVITVGASNQWDKRKTPSSADGETWWGTNWGRGLDLMAPGVAIRTTDISGPAGYSPNDITDGFNGTSAATPFVAAAAALMLSANNTLTSRQVGRLLNQAADPLTAGGGWSRFTGHGRLNAYRALWLARR